MSDTTETPELSIEAADGDLEALWDMLSAAIDQLDEKLDSLNPETGVRRTFLNELDSEFGPSAEEKVANGLIEQLKGYDERKRAGLYLALVGRLNKAFRKEIDTWVETQVEALPKPEAVDISEDEKKELSSKRSEYYAMAKQVFELGTKFKMPFAKDWEMPKIRRGGSGKRGKRALYSYTWAIDGQGVEDDNDTPKGVAELLGYDKVGDFTADLRKCLVTDDEGKSVKLNTTKPPRSFEVTLKGKTVTAEKVDEGSTSEDDSDDDEDDSDEDE